MQDLQQDNSEKDHPQGYILSGGKSKRFGSDKARFELAGVPMISAVANSLKCWTNHIIVIADQSDKYADLQLETIADYEPNLGPLGGLQTAILHAKQHHLSDWIAVTSCDMTILQTAWLDTLWQHTQSSHAYKAVLFEETSPSRFHPFPGLFHLDLLPQVELSLKSNNLSFQKLIHRLVEEVKTIEIPIDWAEVPQINTPEDAKNWQADH